MKRAIRRHHRRRLIKLRKKRLWFFDEKENITDKWNYVANTPTVCSCPMCGNPRKWFGKIKRQERISYINMIEQCMENDIYTQLRINNTPSVE